MGVVFGSSPLLMLPELPVTEALPALRTALSERSNAVLIAPPGAQTITREFSSFDIEENYDFVHVYDGTVADAKFLLKALTGPLRR